MKKLLYLFMLSMVLLSVPACKSQSDTPERDPAGRTPEEAEKEDDETMESPQSR